MPRKNPRPPAAEPLSLDAAELWDPDDFDEEPLPEEGDFWLEDDEDED